MKFIKLDLLTLLISLFLFSACENTATIGLEVDPSIALKGSLVDTMTISSRTVAETVSNPQFAAKHALGYLVDPILGKTDAALSMSVNLPNDAYDFGAQPIVDSAVLVLNYSTEFYGDSTANYSIDVHQLTNNLTKETSYVSNKTYPYNSALLGNKTGKIYPSTPYKITDIVTGGKDTLKTVTPQLRIRLDNSMINNAIVNQDISTRKYNAIFQDLFKGLNVQINKTGSSGKGGIMFLDFAASNSYLLIYYRRQNATTTTAIDTVKANFPITTSTTTYNPTVVLATVTHDYTGTDVATQLAADAKTQFPVTYLQPLAGLRTKIAFPYLDQFIANVGKVAINRAELVIDLSAGTDVAPFFAAPRLALYKYDIAGQRANIPDNNPSTNISAGDTRGLSPTLFGGYFNTATRQYIFVVTAYLQDLLDKKTVDYGTYLASTPIATFLAAPSYANASRSVIGAFKKSPAAGDQTMKLNVYYTKIK